jgi:carbamoyl-phosphate synthase large subunit
MARGERIEPHVGEFNAGVTFTRWYWQTELDERLRPTDRDIVAGGPRPATAGEEVEAPLE